MLQNARATAVTVSELLRENKLGRGWSTQIRVKAEALQKLRFSEALEWRCSVKKTPTQVFSSEFFHSLKNTWLEERLQTIASGITALIQKYRNCQKQINKLKRLVYVWQLIIGRLNSHVVSFTHRNFPDPSKKSTA